MVFEVFELFHVVGDFAQVDLLAVVFGEWHAGAAGVFAGCVDRLADAATCGKEDVVGDVDVADDAGLAAEDDVFAGR